MYKLIGGDGKEYGPVTAEQLRQWLAENRVNQQTRIQSDGGEWKPIAAFPELLSVTPPPLPAPAPKSGDGITALIPYKNTPALVGYYLAVFSLIPCVGAPLGLVAFGLGIAGLRKARQHPEAKGKVHAWVGIILGGLCGFGNLALIIAGIAGLFRS
jgi:hypothetical protein